MVDTLGRIDRVIEAFNVLFKMGQEYNIDLRQQGASRSFANLDKEKAEKLRSAYSAAVTAVYVEFNILLQRDSFMSQRVSTYVRYDLFQRIKTQQDMSPYLNYLLVSSGKNVLNRLREFIGIGADAEADLANAQRINRANLDQLEELFNNDMWTYINDLSKKSGQWHMTNERMNPFHDARLSLSNLHTTVWDFVRPKINPWTQLPSQDDDGALAFLRAKACLHTLGFKDWRKYQTVCRGAVLKSRLTGNAQSELRVQFNYDDLAKEKATSLSQTLDFAIRGAEPEGMRYKNVCSVRDYFRNNQVFWMTLAFQGASGENASPAAAQQPVRNAAPADEIPSPF